MRGLSWENWKKSLHGETVILTLLTMDAQVMIPLVVGSEKMHNYLAIIDETFISSKMNNQTKYLISRLNDASQKPNCPEHLVKFVETFKNKIQIHDMRVSSSNAQRKHFSFLFPTTDQFSLKDKLQDL